MLLVNIPVVLEHPCGLLIALLVMYSPQSMRSFICRSDGQLWVDSLHLNFTLNFNLLAHKFFSAIVYLLHYFILDSNCQVLAFD